MTRMTSNGYYQLLLGFVCVALFAVSGATAWAASLTLSPSTGVYTAGQTFTTRVVVNTAGSAINAAEANISFNPNELSIVSVQKGSTFSLWAVEPSFSNTAGTLTFGGGSPQGYSGSAGTVLTITWRSKSSGATRVTFQKGSILAADGRGTNIAQSLNGGSYTIASAAVTPEPETIEYIAPANTPDRPIVTSDTHGSEGWSQATTAQLRWNVPAGVTAVRTLLDRNSGSIPTNVYEPPISEIELSDLAQGVQYFHLQFRNSDGWGRVAHYRIAVDSEPPSDFTITRSDAYEATSPTQLLEFAITDATSPVTRYVVQHNANDPFEYEDTTGSSTLLVNDLTPGPHTFTIEAFDAAGNSRLATFSFVIESFGAPEWTEYPTEVRPSVVPVFFGTTRPQATVVATLVPVSRGTQGTVPIEYSVVADESGLFRIVPDGRLSEGVYELTATAIDSYGAQSASSEVVRFVVAQAGYVSVGQWAISVMSLLVPLVALLVVLVLLVFYGVRRIRRVARVVRTETNDALEVLDREFASLRKTLAADTETLAHSRKSQQLTKSEQALVDHVNDQLAKTYDTLKREIAEVDDIVE